jgi:POT family proton-dependent oligopeptide transporter
MAFGGAALVMAVALAVGIVSYRWLAATEPKAEQASTELSASPSTSTWTLPAVARLLVAVLLFTATYEQSGQSLLFWARDCTRRSLVGHVLPPSALLAVPGVLVLTLQPILTRLLWALARRGCEPSQLARIRAGILCAVAAYLLMTEAAIVQGHSRAAVSMLWLMSCFVALTLGELLVYPVSLALLTRLAPPNLTAAATGIWMMAVAVGQWLAGEVAARWTVFSHAQFFAGLACLSLGACATLPCQAGKPRRATTEPSRSSTARHDASGH